VIINDSGTFAVIEGENIKISLREKLRVEKTAGTYSWNTYKYFPTGKLILRIDKYSQTKDFIDGEKTLEEKLAVIIAELEYRGQKEKEERIEREIRRAKREEILKIEKERRMRIEKEIKDFRKLMKESESWHKSVILDNYIKEVERKALENNTLTEDLQSWLKWAKQKAEWFNPFIKKEDEFLNESDRLIF